MCVCVCVCDNSWRWRVGRADLQGGVKEEGGGTVAAGGGGGGLRVLKSQHTHCNRARHTPHLKLIQSGTDTQT